MDVSEDRSDNLNDNIEEVFVSVCLEEKSIMIAISTDNVNKIVLFFLLIGLLVFCVYTLIYRTFCCCVII